MDLDNAAQWIPVIVASIGYLGISIGMSGGARLLPDAFQNKLGSRGPLCKP